VNRSRREIKKLLTDLLRYLFSTLLPVTLKNPANPAVNGLRLAGVNEHAGLRIVGSKRWSVAHFLRTIQYLFEHGGLFLAT
jgi:hypothetical protein